MKYIYQMNNNELNHILCPCGDIHEVKYPDVMYGDIVSGVSRLLASGHLLCLRDDDIDGRIFDPIRKDGAWRITEDSILPYQTSYLEEVDDDVRLVVAVGGASMINIAKQIAYEISAKLLVLPIYAYGACLDGVSRVLRAGTLESSRGRMPDIVLVDYDVIGLSGYEYLRAGYATLAGELAILNDYIYRSMRDSRCCPHLIKAVRSAIVPLAKIRGLNISMFRIVSDTMLRVYMLMSMIPSRDSGATQLVSVMYRYLDGKTSDVRLFGENILFTSMITARLYEVYLRHNEFRLTIPPNRGDDIEKMRRILGVDEHKALTHARRYEPEIDKLSYVMNMLRPRLYMEIQVNCMMIDMIRKNVFDSYEDKGYFMRNYIGVKEMFRLISLAPEYVRGDTMLSYIKDTGLLEKLG